LTLLAVIGPAGTGVTGQVTFVEDGTAVLAVVPLTVGLDGVTSATVTVSLQQPGPHSLQAVFTPTPGSIFTGSASTLVQVMVVAQSRLRVVGLRVSCSAQSLPCCCRSFFKVNSHCRRIRRAVKRV
jgi:hypothetical protein